MPTFSNVSMGQEARAGGEAQFQSLVDAWKPTYGEVTDAYVDDAFRGVGTLRADLMAAEVSRAERNGVKISADEYKDSDYFRPAIDYYEGMTEEAAAILADNSDEQEERGFIISQASTGQDIVGFGASFGAGIFEPKNFAIGVATSAVGGPLAGRVVGATRIAKASAKYGKYKVRAGMGAVEGVVASAIAEPSNLESASILQQDYGMADSLMNVGLSTVLGAGLTTIPSYVANKIRSRGKKELTAEIKAELMEELDTVVAQSAEGKLPDASAVSKIREGEISKKPIAEKARAVEEFIRYTETPEFKSKIAGTSILDDNSSPMLVYHGTDKEFSSFRPFSHFGTSKAANERLADFDVNGQRVLPSYLNIKNALEIEDSATGHTAEDLATILENRDILTTKQVDDILDAGDELAQANALSKAMETTPYDGFKYTNLVEDAGSESYITIRPDQIIPAFGTGDVDQIAKQIDVENNAAISTAIKKTAANYDESTVDVNQIEANDRYQATLAEQDRLSQLEEEMTQLAESGILTEDELATIQALGDINEEDILAGYDAAYLCMTRG